MTIHRGHHYSTENTATHCHTTLQGYHDVTASGDATLSTADQRLPTALTGVTPTLRPSCHAQRHSPTMLALLHQLNPHHCRLQPTAVPLRPNITTTATTPTEHPSTTISYTTICGLHRLIQRPIPHHGLGPLHHAPFSTTAHVGVPTLSLCTYPNTSFHLAHT